MTDVADPYRRNDDDVSLVPGVEDVTDLGTEREDEDADLYTQTVKAPGVESDEGTRVVDDGTRLGDDGTSLGDEDTPVTPPNDREGGDQLEHGLGTAGDGFTHDATLEEGTEFGLGSENTQDTPPVPEPDEPDPLRHGLGQADEGAVE